ncbi:tRNA (guanosine(37)-N1)-methyltransferase TrmD [Haliangium sp.]|uniref:tRNA (guanosine(37)-N1)-methyltransferase TrmD n=1 Tax=Haliangium sp. TaxID=2663208 RepID=UPI003D129D72
MRFTVVTIFPEMLAPVLTTGVVGRAIQAGTLSVHMIDPRDFTSDRHRTVDDSPYGGGPGMVMKVEPLVAAIEAAAEAAAAEAEPAGEPERPHRVLMSPAGRALTQERVRELAALAHIVLVCGRYEGVDERVVELAIDEQISIGDFVLSGGEVAAMAVIDAVARYVPGVLGEAASADEESFSEALLEYPHYTRPASFRGLDVPEVLQSGHHERIRTWRRQQALARTSARRPDLLARHLFGDEDRRLWAGLPGGDPAAGVYLALVHYPVYDRGRRVVTSAITNLDLHDIARSTATYGLAGYFVVTPVAAQRDKVARILSVWRRPEGGEGARPGDNRTQPGADNRAEALSGVEAVADVAAARAAIEARHGRPPRGVATSARAGAGALDYDTLRARLHAHPGAPVLLLLGTGWGLADELVATADDLLAPVCGRTAFNHLSVRSAAAVILDRLFGQRGS